jgi:hypothetical protein
MMMIKLFSPLKLLAQERDVWNKCNFRQIFSVASPFFFTPFRPSDLSQEFYIAVKSATKTSHLFLPQSLLPIMQRLFAQI